jgi:hypothetical protein
MTDSKPSLDCVAKVLTSDERIATRVTAAHAVAGAREKDEAKLAILLGALKTELNSTVTLAILRSVKRLLAPQGRGMMKAVRFYPPEFTEDDIALLVKVADNTSNPLVTQAALDLVFDVLDERS